MGNFPRLFKNRSRAFITIPSIIIPAFNCLSLAPYLSSKFQEKALGGSWSDLWWPVSLYQFRGSSQNHQDGSRRHRQPRGGAGPVPRAAGSPGSGPAGERGQRPTCIHARQTPGSRGTHRLPQRALLPRTHGELWGGTRNSRHPGSAQPAGSSGMMQTCPLHRSRGIGAVMPRCSPGGGMSRPACPRRGSTPARRPARRDGSASRRPASLTGGQKQQQQQRRGPVQGLHGGGRCPAAPPLHGERGRPAARRALPLSAAPARRPAPLRIPPPGTASSSRRRRRSGGGEPAGGSALPRGPSAALALLRIAACSPHPGRSPPAAGPRTPPPEPTTSAGGAAACAGRG